MDAKRQTRKIVIVGVCGSGKTLLADGLMKLGYEAHSVSQEHSLVPELFLHSDPDMVICLDASDETVSGRKQTGWEPRQLADQRRRLKLAREKADIRISTDGVRPEELLKKVEKELETGL